MFDPRRRRPLLVILLLLGAMLVGAWTYSVVLVADSGQGHPLLLASLAFLVAVLVVPIAVRWSSHTRRREEEKLLRLTRSLLRSLDQGVVVADRQGAIQVVNEAARRLVGGLEDTVARRGWAAVGAGGPVGAPDAPEALGSLPLDRAVRGEHFADEEFFVRSARAPEGLWLLVSGAPLRSRDDERLGGVVVFRDITASKAQADSHRRLATAVDAAADVITIADVEGRYLYVNDAFEQASGYTREEVLGALPAMLDPSGADTAQHRAMWATLHRGQVYRGTTCNRRKDGSTWYGDRSVTPMRDTQGQVSHYVSVTKDMSDRRQLLDQELEMRLAGAIQQRLYPDHPPQVEGLELAGAVYPAAVTCGDYFDYIELPDGTFGLVVGDVSGHGIGPALIMVEARACLRSLLEQGIPIEQAVTSLNVILSRDMPDDRFVTLLLVHFDPGLRQLTYVNAGHPAALVVTAAGALRAELDATGPALGIIPEARFLPSAVVPVEEGDVIALVTDGLTELPSQAGERYESERLLEVIQAGRTGSAREILEALYTSADAYAAGVKMEDDLTLLIVKVKAGRTVVDGAAAAPRSLRVPV